MSTTLKARAPFRYPLKPLLDWRHWQLDALKAEMSVATQVLRERRQAVEAVGEAIRNAMGALADLRTGGAVLDPQADGRIRRYLERLDGELVQRLSALDEAQGLHDAVAANLRRTLQAANGLERHRDRLKKAHRAEQDIALSNEADEAWLATSAAKEPSPW